MTERVFFTGLKTQYPQNAFREFARSLGRAHKFELSPSFAFVTYDVQDAERIAKKKKVTFDNSTLNVKISQKTGKKSDRRPAVIVPGGGHMRAADTAAAKTALNSALPTPASATKGKRSIFDRLEAPPTAERPPPAKAPASKLRGQQSQVTPKDADQRRSSARGNARRAIADPDVSQVSDDSPSPPAVRRRTSEAPESTARAPERRLVGYQPKTQARPETPPASNGHDTHGTRPSSRPESGRNPGFRVDLRAGTTTPTPKPMPSTDSEVIRRPSHDGPTSTRERSPAISSQPRAPSRERYPPQVDQPRAPSRERYPPQVDQRRPPSRERYPPQVDQRRPPSRERYPPQVDQRRPPSRERYPPQVDQRRPPSRERYPHQVDQRRPPSRERYPPQTEQFRRPFEGDLGYGGDARHEDRRGDERGRRGPPRDGPWDVQPRYEQGMAPRRAPGRFERDPIAREPAYDRDMDRRGGMERADRGPAHGRAPYDSRGPPGPRGGPRSPSRESIRGRGGRSWAPESDRRDLPRRDRSPFPAREGAGHDSRRAPSRNELRKMERERRRLRNEARAKQVDPLPVYAESRLKAEREQCLQKLHLPIAKPN